MPSNAVSFLVKTTKARRALYWVTTIFAAFTLAAAGAADVVRVPKIAEGLLHLGYPAYFATIIGTWKLLGSTAIIVPGLTRLKEWAYAGMFFTLTGASISHAATGDALEKILIPLALLVAVMTSWMLQPARGVGARGTEAMQHTAAKLVVVDIQKYSGHGRWYFSQRRIRKTHP